MAKKNKGVDLSRFADIRFDADTHTYWRGLEELPSVTTLLKWHGLSTDYSDVNPAVLAAAAAKGTGIHEAISQFIKGGYESIDDMHQEYIQYVDWFIGLYPEGIPFTHSEVIVGSDHMAGTIDLLFIDEKNGKIADVKTSYALDKEYCKWQLSLYADLLGGDYEIEAIHINDRIQKRVPLEKVSQVEIIKFITMDKKGEEYEYAQLPAELVTIGNELALELYELEVQVKGLEEKQNAWKESCKQVMRDNSIKKFDNDVMSITYVAPTQKEGVDSKKLKENFPDVYNSCLKISQVKDSVRVTFHVEKQES